MALFAEFLLLMEIVLLPLFYVYSFFSGDFAPLILAMIILSIIIFLQILTDVKRGENKDMVFWVPIAWVIFYFIDFIEYIALAKSIGKIFKRKEVFWQKWERAGVFGK